MSAYPVTRTGWRDFYYVLWARTRSEAALKLAVWYAGLVILLEEE
jgi:hypothetical protein